MYCIPVTGYMLRYITNATLTPLIFKLCSHSPQWWSLTVWQVQPHLFFRTTSTFWKSRLQGTGVYLFYKCYLFLMMFSGQVLCHWSCTIRSQGPGGGPGSCWKSSWRPAHHLRFGDKKPDFSLSIPSESSGAKFNNSVTHQLDRNMFVRSNKVWFMYICAIHS